MNAQLWKRFASIAVAETEEAQTKTDKGKAIAYLNYAIANLQRAVQLLESEREA